MRTLYALRVPADASSEPTTSRALQLATNAALNSDVPEVDSLSASPGSRSLAGVAIGKYADLTASEFEELFSATAIEVVPYFGNTQDQRDGYYALEDIDVTRAAPNESRIQRFDGSLSQAGTADSHRRAVYTNPQPVDNAFGSTSTAEIGLSATATGVEWWDKTAGTREAATVQRTVTGEHGDIDIYDATEPSFDSPVLLHDIAYDQEWQADARCWDDYDRSKTATAADGATIDSVWQRVFVTSHSFAGKPVLESQRLRLVFDVASQQLQASRWSSSNSQYESVSLGSSSWQLDGISLSRVGVERVTAQTRWVDTSGSATHTLDCTVKRGWDDALFTTPPNETSPPSGLVTRLDPIAADSDQTAAEVVDIVANSEVQR
ncbi:hypothetical protein [Haloarcula amylovorans]|uniref:hypothetical protein n=1 Tax=Haloarcula amylovorans TaxID=2562280 RepID=UPI0010763EB1|nr:hypothetical protein [Halomicroarcula amylolytica]